MTRVTEISVSHYDTISSAGMTELLLYWVAVVIVCEHFEPVRNTARGT
jgi:hypothetical protein